MLQSPLFRGNARLALAATNAPPMRRDEPDIAAVRLLQQALRDLGVATMRQSIDTDGTFDGIYGGETFRAVQKFQRENGLGGRTGRGDGAAGQNTLGLMDTQLSALGVTPQTPEQAAAAPPPTETPSTLDPVAPKIPSAARLRQEYNRFLDCKGKPCRARPKGKIIQHQCAIRMTIALGRSDIGFRLVSEREGDLHIHHAGSNYCGGHLDTMHDAGARRVYTYMKKFWTFVPHRIRRGYDGADIYNAIKGDPAIIFFDKLKTGTDHIDYFDGTKIMNDLLNYAAPDEPNGDDPDDTFRKTVNGIYVMSINP